MRESGTISLQQNQIIGTGFSPGNHYEDAAAIMVANAIENNWPSIQLGGSNQALKDAVLVESYLQGIKIDLDNSPDYRSGPNVTHRIEERCAELGIDITGPDGKNDYHKAFGKSPLHQRMVPAIPVNAVVMPPPPPPSSSNSAPSEPKTIIIPARVVPQETETDIPVTEQNVGSLGEEPILGSEPVPIVPVTTSNPFSNTDIIWNQPTEPAADVSETVVAPEQSTGSLGEEPILVSPPITPEPVPVNPGTERNTAAQTKPDQPFDGFYLEAHTSESNNILRIRSTPTLDMFHGGIPANLTETVENLRSGANDARVEALGELEDLVGTEPPKNFIELEKHTSESNKIAARFDGNAPYIGIAETDQYYVSIVKSMSLEGPRKDSFPIYDLTHNNAAELIVWADKSKYESPEAFQTAVKEHAVEDQAADFRRYRSYFNPKDISGEDIYDAKLFPPYRNASPRQDAELNAANAVPPQNSGALFGNGELPETNLGGFRNRTSEQTAEHKPAPPPPRMGM